MKPTTLGNFQPLVDNILTGLKTCANKSNFPRESGSRKQKKKDLKIIGGVTTSEHDWPWLVYLEMGCGGTIIHEEWVLTGKTSGAKTCKINFQLHIVAKENKQSKHVLACTIQTMGQYR